MKERTEGWLGAMLDQDSYVSRILNFEKCFIYDFLDKVSVL